MHDWERPLHRAANLTVILFVGLVAGAIGWAARAETRAFAVLAGRLEPKSGTVLIKAPAAGRLTSIHASHWENVEANQVLFSIDDVLEVRSPVSGKVARLLLRYDGEIIAQGQPLAEILPESVPMVFRAQARESDRPKLRILAEAEVAWNGDPRQKFGVSRGRVIGISPTSHLNGKVPVYEVEIRLEDLSLRGPSGVKMVFPGMAGEARVISSKKTVLQLFVDWLRGVDPSY